MGEYKMERIITFGILLAGSMLYTIGCASSEMIAEMSIDPPRLDSLEVQWKLNADSEDSTLTMPDIYLGDGYQIEETGSIRITKTDYESPDIDLTIKVFKDRLSRDSFETVTITPGFKIGLGYRITPTLIQQSLGHSILDKQYIEVNATRGTEAFNMFVEYKGKSKLMNVALKEDGESESISIESLYNPPGTYTIERGGSLIITPADRLGNPIDIKISLSNDRSLSKGFTSVPITTLFQYPNGGKKITPELIEEVIEKDLPPNSYIIIEASRGEGESFLIYLQYKRKVSWSGVTSPALLRMEGGFTGWFKLENLAPSLASGIQIHIDDRKFNYLGVNALVTVFQRAESNEYSIALGPSVDFSSYFQLGYSYHLGDKNWFFTLGLRPESLLEKLFPSFSSQ